MKPQQRRQLLIGRDRGHEAATVAEREDEGPQLARPAAVFDLAQVAPTDLRLFAGGRFEAANGDGASGCAQRLQMVSEDRVAACVAAFAQFGE